jgi:hypothetical protein
MTWLVTRATFEGNNVGKAQGAAQNSQAQTKQRLRLNSRLLNQPGALNECSVRISKPKAITLALRSNLDTDSCTSPRMGGQSGHDKESHPRR